jgi:2,3-bisphosphoglycerate-dependent phosphoglycerate mutase
MNPTRITAIRHGETAWNVDTRIQGQLDIGLNAKGRWQAECAGQALAGDDIAVVYSSDLWRAYDTALSVAKPHGLTVVTDEGLRERGFGEFQGKTFAEIEAALPEQSLKWRKRVPDFAPPGGESLLQLRERVLQCVSRLAQAHPGQHIVVVSHGGVMDILYRAATGLDLQAPRTWDLHNAAINRLLWNGEHFSLVGWADTSHIDNAVFDAEQLGSRDETTA